MVPSIARSWKKQWFVMRRRMSGQPDYYETARGQIIWLAARAGAQRRADKLNAAGEL